jgi:SAM-dependent methyltransferase
MGPELEQEAARVRAAYARRAERGLDARYDYWTPANLYIYHSRERALLRALWQANMLPLAGRRVLDVGCGDGGVLRELLRYGATPDCLHGIDLLEERVERAREQTPGAHIQGGDAQALPFDDACFDLVLGFTLLSSVLPDEARQRIAAQMTRVTRPGGLIVLYDFRLNPTNRDARPLKRDDVRSLFADRRIELHNACLAPPIVRLLAPLPGGRLACTALEVLPFLQTHYIAAIHV